jgi:hypothetical protein
MLDRRPSIPLDALRDERGLDTFTKAMDWAFDTAAAASA